MNAVWPHLPALQVVIPLLGALLAGLLRRGSVAFALALVVSWIMPFIAVAMLWQTLSSGPISYHLGGWEPPWGIEYRVDALNGFVLVLVSTVGAVIMPFARRSVAFEVAEGQQAWFYCMYLLCLTGLLGITVTGDAFNAFVFLEISSLSTYVLIALGHDRRALLSAFQYLIMGTIGATFYVIGVGLLYLLTGSLNMVDIAARLGPAWAEHSRADRRSPGVRDSGHQPEARVVPAPRLAAQCLRLCTVMGNRLPVRHRDQGRDLPAGPVLLLDLRRCDRLSRPAVTEIIIALSVAAMFVASFIAVFETNLKRMLAYSSVAQIGYITLGIGLANQAGLTGGLVHVVNHALMKAALFLAVGAIFYRVGTVQLQNSPASAARCRSPWRPSRSPASVSSARPARPVLSPNGTWRLAHSTKAGGCWCS